MANATVSRIGSDLAGGGSDVTGLFLKVFSGEVLTAFNEKNLFLARTMVRNIVSGKSAQFPIISKTTASYHTVGVELVGTELGHAEQVVTIDDLLISDAFIASIDDAMNHYDVRAEYAKQLGESLALTLDKHILQLIYIASAASQNLDGSPGVASPAGQSVTDADAATNADSLVQSIFDSVQILDENDVPDDERYIALAPAQYYLLVNSSSKAINYDYNPATVGSVQAGNIVGVAGAEIVKTNNLPNGSNIDDDAGAKYDIDATNHVAAVFHRGAVATVKLVDVASEMEWDIRRQGWLLVSKMILGSDYLRPESSVAIVSA